MMNLHPEHVQIVRSLVKKHLPERQVLIFGSRVKGTTKPYADLDLAVMGGEPVPFSALGALREDFMESRLPFRVDVIDLAAVGDEFRNIVERDGVSLF